MQTSTVTSLQENVSILFSENSSYSPTIVTMMLSLPLCPPLVAVQVWVPPSPELSAPRIITLVVPLNEVWKAQLEQVDVHTY